MPLKALGVSVSFRPSPGLWGEIKSLFGKSGSGGVKAVRGVTLEIKEGETLGLVGESGSGKSTLGRLFGALYKPDAGEILFEGKNVFSLSKKERKNFFLKVQYMFQDPASSLSPRRTAGKTLSEGLVIHKLGDAKTIENRVLELLGEVGLDSSFRDRYPHQFSGGQRQRLSLARALSLNPKVLIADEPASALDVSVQAQIVNLLLEEKKKRGLTLVIISHDLALVSLIAQRIAIMYGGLLMEIIPKELLGEIDHHPYVKALWASAEYAALPASPDQKGLILEGEPPDPENPPPGCPFHPRCPEAIPLCRATAPSFLEDAPGHFTACHRREPKPT
jgi:peptide/nickel transport system ATP-binding protein